MSPRLASLILSSSLLSAAALAGCSSEHDAAFADATPAQLERAYSAAVGFDMFPPLVLAILLADEHATDGCPSVVVSGRTTTITGGCTEDGIGFEGSIAIQTFEADPETEEPSRQLSIELDFALTSAEGERIAFDGRVELGRDPSAPFLRGDLTTDFGGIASTSRLNLTCGDADPCIASPGPEAEIEISGLGGARIDGAWSLGDPPSGQAILRGADTLILDIAGLDGGCVPYRIGQQSGETCRPDNFFFDLIDFRRGDAPMAAEQAEVWWPRVTLQ